MTERYIGEYKNLRLTSVRCELLTPSVASFYKVYGSYPCDKNFRLDCYIDFRVHRPSSEGRKPKEHRLTILSRLKLYPFSSN